MSNRTVNTNIPCFRPPVCGRSSWAGEIVLGSLRAPVRAFPASVTSSTSLLHQIHAGCGQRIEQRKSCPMHGPLEAAEIDKVYEYAPQQPVILSTQELTQLQAVDDRALRIQHLLPDTQIDLAMLSGRTLCLVPANPIAVTPYALAVQVLSKAGAWGIGTAVFSERRQLVAAHAADERLLVHVLHWPACLRSAPLDDLPKPALDSRAVNRLEQSLANLRKPFSWSDYCDEYETRLLKLVGQKIAAQSPPSKKPMRSAPQQPVRTVPIGVVPKPRRGKAA